MSSKEEELSRRSDQSKPVKPVKASSWMWAILLPGIVSVLLGIAAIALPIFGPVTIVRLLICIFIISGIAKIIYGILSRKAGGFLGKLLDGIVDLILAILIFASISTESLSLILSVRISIFTSGVLAVIRSFQRRPAFRWDWFLFSGMMRIFLGIIIWSEWLSYPEWLIAKIFGIFFIISGSSLIILGLTVRLPTGVNLR